MQHKNMQWISERGIPKHIQGVVLQVTLTRRIFNEIIVVGVESL